MKLLLPLLFIPFAFANRDHCQGLGKSLQDYEKDLQKSAVNNCRNLKAEDLLRGQEGIKDTAFLNGKVCSELTTIESNLERLKAQLSVYDGIEKLQTHLQSAKFRAGRGDTESGNSFVTSLNIAQSLEQALLPKTKDNKNILQKIKEVPANSRLNENDLMRIVTDVCKEVEDKTGACAPGAFKPGPEAAAEIYRLIETDEPHEQNVLKWKNKLAIKKKNPQDDSPYSFTIMQERLSGALSAIDSKKVMERAHLKAIAQLDDFVPAEDNFDYVKKLIAFKDNNEAALLSNKLMFIMGDAKNRQAYEVQSKMSVAWENYKHKLQNFPDAESCNKAKSDISAAYTCHEKLNAFLKDNNESHSLKKEILPSIKASMDYVQKLHDEEKNCTAEIQQKSYTETCFSQLATTKAELQDQIRQWNILKDRIGSENQKKMTFRNFTLKKWAEYNCSPISTSIEFCELSEGTGTLTKNALQAVSDSMSIAVTYAPRGDADEKMSELCENDAERKTEKEKDLCKLLEKTETVIVTNNASASLVEGPTKAPSGNHEEAVMRDRYLQAGTGLLKDVLRHFIPQVQPPMGVNPYPYNYAPYNGGLPPMGIADSIMFNARYHGAYGFYMPTPGYQPYTAFGASSALSSYRPVSSVTPTRYFGR